jgi:hypothetical protein
MRLALASFIVLAACDGGSTLLAPGTTVDEPVPVTRDCGLGLPNDGFSLGSAMTITDRVLKVSVSYGGGCEEHTFAACWNGGISKTSPSTFAIELHHDAHQDLCDAFVTRDLFIDLSTTPEGFGAPVRVGDTSILLTQQL